MEQGERAHAAEVARYLARWLCGIVTLGVLAYTALVATMINGHGALLSLVVLLLVAAVSGAAWLGLWLYDRN